MKAIVVMFDSLNRHYLSPYGNDWTHTPHFQRLAEKSVTFETSYVCSMPCMPARRDLHTGRPNFLHRSWGPLEPWDSSCFAQMKAAGVHCHITTDHQHYWEPGAGGNYLFQYSTHEMIRGQEGDPFYAMIPPPDPEPNACHRNANTDTWTAQDRANRSRAHSTEDMPQAQTFANGLDFIERHAQEDNWLLQIETFDPHEPFFSQPEFKNLYAERYEELRDMLWDWPPYAPRTESDEEVQHMRLNYAALVSMCDACLGKVLDTMDRHALWEDTLLIVCTDHGFLLGEQDSWAKCWVPFYEEVARTPFFVWDPRSGKRGERRNALVQPALDMGPTLLNYFGLPPLPHATGRDLAGTVDNNTPVREHAIFGIHGGQVNITDGRYVYMRGPASPENQPLCEYTLMPAHMRGRFDPSELQDHTLARPFPFMQGVSPLRIPAMPKEEPESDRLRTLLYDLKDDPGQQRPITDPSVENRLVQGLDRLLREADAPEEQWQRLGLSTD